MELFDFIEGIISGKSKIEWNYYRTSMNTNDVFNPSGAYDFISQYFQEGAKMIPLLVSPNKTDAFIHYHLYSTETEITKLLDFDTEYKLPESRAVHTTFGFFLGLLIEDCLCGKNHISVLGENEFPFCYLWYLTFLYHDFGYCVAEKENCPIRIPRYAPTPRINKDNKNRLELFEYKTFNMVKRQLNIIISIFSQYKINTLKNKDVYSNIQVNLLNELTKKEYTIKAHNKLKLTNGTVIANHQYTSATTIRYFNYTISERQKADHGILGGYLFYDRIIKNYILAYILASKENRDYEINFKDFYFFGRHFCAEQLNVFSYIADCISSHNIWKQPPEARELYEKYRLTQLYSENFRKISFENNPLLYILVIADSIEPTKIYDKLPASVIAKSLNIEYIPGDRKIEIHSKSDCLSIEPLYKKAKSLEDWTTVRCSKLLNSGFILNI